MACRGLLPDEFLNALDPTERGQLWAEALVAPRPGVTRLVICPDVGKEPVGFAVVGPVRAAGDNGSVGGGAGDSGLAELHAINLDLDSWAAGSDVNYWPLQPTNSADSASAKRACGW